ncbi:uncharacterized protein [Dermacentor andersoni]|uniref:uncharacterized protein n=1 Tax=Dermacentor andersoni TaxID=34620 RepID=UPI002155A4D9|nr:protein phosphatase inhibitor 2-like [Dermacentor andersoni]
MASGGPGSSKDQPPAKRSALKRTDSTTSGKSILRAHKGSAKSVLQASPDAAVKWNEENVKKTFHPKDKDYGMMKVAEPKTPYSYDMTKEQSSVDAHVLAQRIESCRNETLKAIRIKREDEENMTEAQKERQHDFEKKRKMHYNEFQAAREARERMKKEEEEEEDEDEETQTKPGGDEGCGASQKEVTGPERSEVGTSCDGTKILLPLMIVAMPTGLSRNCRPYCLHTSFPPAVSQGAPLDGRASDVT